GALEPSDKKSEVEATWRLAPDALITFGAGTNQLVSQKVLADKTPEMERNPVLAAVWAILGVAGTSLWLYSTTTVTQILRGGVVALLLFTIMRVWGWFSGGPMEE